jgi:hypothetical protein
MLAEASGTEWANATVIAHFSDNGKLVVCNVTHPAIDNSLPTQKELHVFCEK